jgi:glycosyltransferase involved in cell wall biosynthesis
MKPLGYDIIHYGVEGAETDSNTHINVMTQDEQIELMGHDHSDKTRFYGDDATSNTKLYEVFNTRLRDLLKERVSNTDLVLLPFGHGHWQAVGGQGYNLVESGIGYPHVYSEARFKVFESNAWMHVHQGKANRNGNNYEWVIPNYFDLDQWTLEDKPDDYIAYLGRICDVKGLQTVVALAKELPNQKFIICGQGDPKPYLLYPNIEYKEPIHGMERNTFLGKAKALIMPSQFTEPFGGVAVEAQLCGTPVLSTTFGAFTETIEDEITGFRCYTLGDFIAGYNRIDELDRYYISERARTLYGFERVGKMYDRAFKQIDDLHRDGWYSKRSIFNRNPVE